MNSANCKQVAPAGGNGADLLPKGFQAGAGTGGLKHNGTPDVGLLVSSGPATFAAVFTRNQFAAAPVQVDREILQQATARAVVANAGVANAITGLRGLAAARATQEMAARLLGIPASQVALASTGVIGQQLPLEAMEKGVRQAAANLSRQGGPAFARAILTTDTRPKIAVRRFRAAGRLVTLTGIAKGAGMIHPQLGTMLAFLVTDAAMDAQTLQTLLSWAADNSFNMISVDGDSSTNDTVMCLANGMAPGGEMDGPETTEARPGPAAEEHEAAAPEPLDGHDRRLFAARLLEVCQELAIDIAADGEGATRLLEVTVQGAACEADARQIARTIVRSNLVKAALFGADPNWGRILCAAGYAGVPLQPERVRLSLAGIPVVQDGEPLPADAALLRSKLQQPRVNVILDLGLGQASATGWGCDLTYEYVRINAEYHT